MPQRPDETTRSLFVSTCGEGGRGAGAREGGRGAGGAVRRGAGVERERPGGPPATGAGGEGRSRLHVLRGASCDPGDSLLTSSTVKTAQHFGSFTSLMRCQMFVCGRRSRGRERVRLRGPGGSKTAWALWEARSRGQLRRPRGACERGRPAHGPRRCDRQPGRGADGGSPRRPGGTVDERRRRNREPSELENRVHLPHLHPHYPYPCPILTLSISEKSASAILTELDFFKNSMD